MFQVMMLSWLAQCRKEVIIAMLYEYVLVMEGLDEIDHEPEVVYYGLFI